MGIGGTGRQTPEALVQELFVPKLDEIKHEVVDEAQRERTHPAFVSLSEQWESFTQEAQRLPRRCTLVQLPERDGVRRLRTVTVRDGNISSRALEELKRDLARKLGKPREAMERAIARREIRSEREEIEYYEPAEEAEAGRESLAVTGSPPV